MAREIVVEHEGAVSRFALSRLSRDKLYGRKRRVVVDEHGEECTQARLTRDGAAILTPGSTASMYVDPRYDAVEQRDLIAVDADGEALEPVESTLGEEQPLRGPVPAQRVLDHVTSAVYELDPNELDDALRDALARGEIFETRFAYRSGYDTSPMFLLQNDEGVFALVCDDADFGFIEKATPASDDDDDPFGDDDLDFSMF